MWGYRDELAGAWAWAKRLAVPSLLGGLAGALLLLVTPAERFDEIVPWLVLGATLLFVVQKPAHGGRYAVAVPQQRWTCQRPDHRCATESSGGARVSIRCCVYGGYFGAGIGILMLAALGFMGFTNIHRMNGLKNWGGLCINVAAALTFALSGLVNWPVATAMALGATSGAMLARDWPSVSRSVTLGEPSLHRLRERCLAAVSVGQGSRHIVPLLADFPVFAALIMRSAKSVDLVARRVDARRDAQPVKLLMHDCDGRMPCAWSRASCCSFGVSTPSIFTSAMPQECVLFSGVSTCIAIALREQRASPSDRAGSGAARPSAPSPMPRLNAAATAIALWLAAGCVPISSNFRMLSSISVGAAISGHSDLILSRRT